jgi:glucan phosphoethanolaminetransferase (alkaline phosphatase superfamily)
MNEPTPSHIPGPSPGTRARSLRPGEGGALLRAFLLVLASEALFAHGWLGVPLPALVGHLALAAPALLLVVVLLASLRSVPARVFALIVLVTLAYAEYAFYSFYGRLLGPGEIHLARENPTHELFASIALYFSRAALAASLAASVAYALVLWRQPLRASALRAAGAFAGILAWCALVGGATQVPVETGPLALATTGVRYAFSEWQERRQVRPTRHAAPAPTRPAADFDVLYVIGESIRADRLRTGTYPREVAPRLHALKMPHVEFSNVTSHGDCTGRSVPMLMVQPAAPLHRDLYRRPTLFGYAKQAGYRTAFVNSNENDWHEFVDEHIDVLHRNIEPAPGDDNWTFRRDTDMLPIIDQLANAPGRQFLVVETYTSHWPYGDRYESCAQCRVFRPDLVHKPVPFEDSHRAAITNSYDNAILYLDRFLASTLALLHKPTLIVLTSDHGESLGDEGRWGHCSAGIEQMLVPLMLIATDERVAREAGFDALAARTDMPLSHANILPTLLRIFGYDPGALEFRYAPELSAVPAGGDPARRVLVSEIGAGREPVSFGVVNPRRGLERVESALPPQ